MLRASVTVRAPARSGSPAAGAARHRRYHSMPYFGIAHRVRREPRSMQRQGHAHDAVVCSAISGLNSGMRPRDGAQERTVVTMRPVRSISYVRAGAERLFPAPDGDATPRHRRSPPDRRQPPLAGTSSALSTWAVERTSTLFARFSSRTTCRHCRRCDGCNSANGARLIATAIAGGDPALPTRASDASPRELIFPIDHDHLRPQKRQRRPT
jgi:hypothetical protein